MNVGKNIRKIRELKGYSQEYVANAMSISQRSYCRFEKDEGELNLTRLTQISTILEVTPQQIMGFDERFIFENCTNAFGINENYYACSQQEKEQYKAQINHLEAEILFLRSQIEVLTKRLD